MVDKDNIDDDFEPFDDDGNIPDVSIDNDLSTDAQKDNDDFDIGVDDFSADIDSDEDLLLDDTPKISEDKKKNIVMMVLGLLIVVYFVYQFTLGKEEKVAPPPKTELDRMQRKQYGEVAPVTQDIPDQAPVVQNDEINPSDIIPPAPPPPVIEIAPEPDIAEESFPTFSDDEGGANDIDDLPSFSSGEDSSPPVGDPFARNNNNNPVNTIPGLPPIDDFGEPPGVIDNGDSFQAPPDLNQGDRRRLVEKQQREAIQQRMNAGMMLVQGIEPRPQPEPEPEEDPEEIFELNTSGAERSDVTKVWHLDSLILQGKVIDAVLETAIDSDLPGRLRAIVARDVYAESGKRILIPKGSRLIGAFDERNEPRFGQSRVLIVWSRVIRPDGIDAVLDEGSESMIATDFLGRPGARGEIDNRFAEIFGSAVLISSLTVAFATIAEGITGAQNNTQVGAQGNVIDQSTATAQAVREAVFNLQNDTRRIAEGLLPTTPRVTVDQGTRIKIFVNRDIRFPRPVTAEEDGPIEILN